MDDMKALVKLLAAIKAAEGEDFNAALFATGALGMTEKERDMNALRLVKAGYVEGLRIPEVDGQRYPKILWEHSAPMITIAGLAFISENSAFRRAVEEIKSASVQIASSAIQSMIITKF